MSQNQNFGGDDSSDKRRSRLMIGLSLGAIVVAIVLAYWRLQPEAPTRLAPGPELAVPDGYVMVCNKCKASFPVKRSEFETWPRINGAFKCPKCGSGNTEPDRTKSFPGG